MADLTSERMARLRVWAHGGNPDCPVDGDRGGCPWCGDVGPDGNAHDIALELLDEIDRLSAVVAAAEEYRAECECPAPDLLMRAQRRIELFEALAKREAR